MTWTYMLGWMGLDGTAISDRPTTIAPLKAVLITKIPDLLIVDLNIGDPDIIHGVLILLRRLPLKDVDDRPRYDSCKYW